MTLQMKFDEYLREVREEERKRIACYLYAAGKL